MVIQKQESKNWWDWVVIGILVFVVIILFIELNSVSLEEIAESKVAELNDEVKTSNLLFTLDNAQLDTQGFSESSSSISIDSHILFLDFIVTNVGDNMENVSDCGVLLFEDGSQYRFSLNPSWTDISEECNYYEMVPGSKMMITSNFYFVDSSRGLSFWKGYHTAWDKVPGSKITYFSQQSNELIKIVIDKSEIIHT